MQPHFEENCEYFAVLRIRNVYTGSEFFHPGSQIQGFKKGWIFFYPGSEFFPSRIRIFSIPDPGFIKARDPGSGSATLILCVNLVVFIDRRCFTFHRRDAVCCRRPFPPPHWTSSRPHHQAGSIKRRIKCRRCLQFFREMNDLRPKALIFT